MNEKIYCSIMNRIKELMEYDENASESDLTIKINLVGGKTLQSTIYGVNLQKDFLEIWAPSKVFKTVTSVPVTFVPLENIISISV